jgi:hypothetical protein
MTAKVVASQGECAVRQEWAAAGCGLRRSLQTHATSLSNPEIGTHHEFRAVVRLARTPKMGHARRGMIDAKESISKKTVPGNSQVQPEARRWLSSMSHKTISSSG